MFPANFGPPRRVNLGWNVKRWFFNREVVLRAMDRVTREALAKAGAQVRMIARRSMRYVTSLSVRARELAEGKRKRLGKATTPSPPGTPPRAVRPHPWIRQFLFYAYDPRAGSVVVGPVGFQTRVNVPALHEYGGRVFIRNRRRRFREVGQGGEVRVGGRPGRTTKPVQDRHGRIVQVTYARLRTGDQAARANRLNEELYGPASYMATYPPRPYMGPALAAVQPGLSRLWATSVRRVA
jgi:hypothetical protein